MRVFLIATSYYFINTRKVLSVKVYKGIQRILEEEEE